MESYKLKIKNAIFQNNGLELTTMKIRKRRNEAIKHDR